MNTLGERKFIYGTLALVCGLISPLVGVAGALWSFLQIVAVIELVHWIGIPRGESAREC